MASSPPGRTPSTAAHRELREELGVDAELRPVLTRWYRDDTAHYLAHLYEARWDGTPLVLQPSEVAGAWWEDTATLRRRAGRPRLALRPRYPGAAGRVAALVGGPDRTARSGPHPVR